ncbi:DNA binding protein, XRE-like protein [Azotobacter vinelandii CA]|uniref:DNA binding protein, XRE-like protein n=2 Tax=Azotobacter vinelandii TaxID=354 RepID=C1DFT3_AZOVD|nr:helix-turn-helix transcriptional regulator [Azotobacter vinelandii]ACO80479.1 DNA binding protein, XRE-like protein [Azotobacter vinelandii DJ]AGK14388.1 DNA binding protein, XRE-like protein [Azotobacter vinelandii CA]AGK21938.1 DNA binding protein, XRE-like protein [Azotobacter vinelandii CA6]SFX35256.1 Helix-turn-helix domain-containing protein [Azotobacter vinelandii]GLK58525.1 hypothetical protein GCM10017624_06820 [Azotobacter vinelandii]
MSIETLGRLVRRLRREKGLSQQALAQRLGMSRATISGLENNSVHEVGIRKIEALLNLLGHSLTAEPLRGRSTLDEVVKEGFHGDR